MRKYVFICKEPVVLNVTQEQYYLYQVGDKICFESYDEKLQYLFNLLFLLSVIYSIYYVLKYIFG